MARETEKRRNVHNPFQGFVDLMSEFNRAQEQWMLHGQKGGSSAAGEEIPYVPPTDIFAQGRDLFIRCEVPGVRKEEVAVNVSGGMLIVEGYRDSELHDDAVYYTRERAYGTFRRSMLLPEGVTDDAVEAHFQNGLLQISVRGGAEARSRPVTISGEDD